MKAATGEYLVLLNPDTLLIEDVFSPQLDWLAENEEVGICIPKVLNSDGTFQAQSKRGDAKPAAVFGYFLGLGKLFPQNRPLNSYLMSWLDEDEISEVDAVSGSCMIIRRECWEQVGDFDEAFFRLSGRQRLLHPCPKSWLEGHVRAISAIIHYGGQGGSKARPYKSIWEWHRSYFVLYKKHFAKDHFFLFNWIYYAMMGIKLGLSLLANIFRRK